MLWTASTFPRTATVTSSGFEEVVLWNHLDFIAAWKVHGRFNQDDI